MAEKAVSFKGGGTKPLVVSNSMGRKAELKKKGENPSLYIQKVWRRGRCNKTTEGSLRVNGRGEKEKGRFSMSCIEERGLQRENTYLVGVCTKEQRIQGNNPWRKRIRKKSV